MPLLEMVAKLPRPIAYVFGGGASYGSVQVGQLKALANTDITPDFVVGTSVGSLNGAVVAEDFRRAPEHLEVMWLNMTRKEVFGKVLGSAYNLATKKGAVVNNEGLREVIESAVTARTFEQLALPHTAVTTDFGTGEVVPIGSGDLVSALLASSAIPLIFPPVKRADRLLVDGGVLANVPISQAAALGAQTIVVLDCGFTVMPPEQEDTALGRLLRTAAIVAAQQVRRDLKSVDDRYVLYLPGPWPMSGRPDDFKDSAERIERSYELVMEWLPTVNLVGPGRYGTAPSDMLITTKVLPAPDQL